MADLSPHEHRAGAAAAGRDPGVTDRAIRLAATIRERGCEPVLTLGELAARTGAPSRYLREIVQRQRDPYDEIARPKRDGTTRPISSPEPVLMDVQRWILHEILTGAPAHRCSWAYRSGHSIADCARQHAGARWLVKLDIHDFFSSIDEVAVFEIFRQLEYPRLMSFEFSRLCTRSRWGVPYGSRVGAMPHPHFGLRGVLPQGAPTSGALANAAMASADNDLDELANRFALTYTRYSDDMVFSARGAFSRSDASKLIAKATAVLARHDLQVHARKTAVVTPRARKIVLGLLLRDDGVALSPWFRRRLETHVRGVRIFGPVDHAAHRRFRSVLSMIEHVYGCIAFAKDVEPEYAVKLLDEWQAALRSHGYPAPES